MLIPAVVIPLRALALSSSLGSWLLQIFYLDKLIAVTSFLGGSTVYLFFHRSRWAGKPAARGGGPPLPSCCCFGPASRVGGLITCAKSANRLLVGSTLAFYAAGLGKLAGDGGTAALPAGLAGVGVPGTDPGDAVDRGAVNSFILRPAGVLVVPAGC